MKYLMRSALTVFTLIVFALCINSVNAQEAEGSQEKQEEKQEEKESIVVPQGTNIVVALGTTLSTKQSQAGNSFHGTVEQDIIIGNIAAIPAGSKVQGKVVSVESGKRLRGQASIVIALTKVELNGFYHDVITHHLALQGQEQGKKTARNVATGAAVGAAFGGGSGAGKGAAIMGGATLLANDGSITVPKGTVIQFPLAEPFTLNQ
jgi:hypothetical protein